MAFVHPGSCECTKSELDLFSLPQTQTSVEAGSWVEFHPLSTLTHGAPIEFNISGSGQDYIDLANTQLYVKAQIVKDTGAALANGDHVGPINLFLHSLFSEVDIALNDTVVTSSNNTYAYRAYLETLLSYGRDAKKSQLTSSLYYKDSATHFEETNGDEDGCQNLGLKARTALSHDAPIDLIGNLHADLFFQSRYILNDVNIKVRLVRNKDAFCLMAPAGSAFKVNILDCKLFVRKMKISPSVFVAHAKVMETTTAKYPIRRAVCKSFTIPRGNLDVSQESLFSGQLPCRIVLGLVDNDSYNGSYSKNPFNFKHHHLNQVKIYLDGQQQSLKPIEPDYANNQFIAAYSAVFAGTGKLARDEGLDITREDYSGGYALYCYDLTPDLAEDIGHFNLIKQGNIRLDLKFSQALANTINVIAYAEFESVLEIDRNRAVIYDYKN